MSVEGIVPEFATFRHLWLRPVCQLKITCQNFLPRHLWLRLVRLGISGSGLPEEVSVEATMSEFSTFRHLWLRLASQLKVPFQNLLLLGIFGSGLLEEVSAEDNMSEFSSFRHIWLSPGRLYVAWQLKVPCQNLML
jgi:hypothetical protein